MYEITVTRDVPYAVGAGGPDQHLDVFRPSTGAPAPLVLLWHGVGPDEKDVMGTLAEQVARRGQVVVVPDWRADAPDGGRAHLLASLASVREHGAVWGGDPERVVLAGWSAGAGAAVGVALHPELVAGWRPAAVVAISGRYDVPARTTGRPPLDSLGTTRAHPVPVRLVHGRADALVPSRHSEEFAARLREQDWDANLALLDTDHAGTIMTTYDAALGRPRPGGAPDVERAGHRTADLCAGAGQHPARVRPKRLV
ncbi:alpha/beta hydrolase [Streptomyces sp. NPDC102406]|uniref:alpha/beta hydrolase n=1 Tax=Streptomyces sp. NPDC102406 TaxID=3366171 RepID=UPI0038025C76